VLVVASSTPQVSTIGWIGAGRMGAALVRRLLAAGYHVAVFNRTRAALILEQARRCGLTLESEQAEVTDGLEPTNA
jgi:3-hydroxyisobutyrate dehydrogenase-like beta-hydroxyacid dehydrogenase